MSSLRPKGIRRKPKIRPSVHATVRQILARELILTDPDETAVKAAFEKFRATFPGRGATANHPWAKAWFAFVQLVYVDGIDPKAILDGAQNYAAQIERNERIRNTPYVPMVTTWLNAGRYEDYATDASLVKASDTEIDDVLRLI